MRFRSIAVLFALILGLAACDTAPIGPQDQLEAEMVVLFRDTINASLMASECPGVRLRYGSDDAMVDVLFRSLEVKGYSASEIDRAASRMQFMGITERIEAYNAARGAAPGDFVAFCDLARREAGTNTPLGQWLVRG